MTIALNLAKKKFIPPMNDLVYSPPKLSQKVFKDAKREVWANDAAILFELSNKKADPSWVNVLLHTYLEMDRVAHYNLIHTPTRWSLYQAVMCEDQNGDRYIKSQVIEAREPYTFAELVETGKDEITALTLGANPEHRRGVFQLASPIRRDWDEVDMFRLLERTGVFA